MYYVLYIHWLYIVKSYLYSFWISCIEAWSFEQLFKDLVNGNNKQVPGLHRQPILEDLEPSISIRYVYISRSNLAKWCGTLLLLGPSAMQGCWQGESWTAGEICHHLEAQSDLRGPACGLPSQRWKDCRCRLDIDLTLFKYGKIMFWWDMYVM